MPLDRHSKPKLRHVEPVSVLLGGKEVIGLRDPLQLCDRMLCVSKDALVVLSMLDGSNSLLDIQASLSARAGRIVFIEDISSIVERLDEANLLEGDRFREAFAASVARFRRLPFRPASHAGVSYSDDPEALKAQLDTFFLGDGGPGAPDLFSDTRQPVGLIAPHIDIRAGGACFARGYHALGVGRPSDVYVILGTGHAGVEQMFATCTLDYRTPLGTARTDRELLELVSAELGRDTAEEEILHAREHVIEFQVIFLQHLFSGHHQFKILPVLCSFSHHIFEDQTRFAHLKQRFHEFCRALKTACAARSESVCFIASADLDHIGPRYGDRFSPHRGTVRDALGKDEQMLEALERVSVEDFIRYVVRENDARRICGFSPITTMLHCMDATQGCLLKLDYAQVDDRSSFVSFASMIFY